MSTRAGESPGSLRVLLAQEGSGWAALVGRTLARADGGRFEVEQVGRLDAALARLEQQSFDLLMVDLSLPDAYGTFTIASACAVADAMPVILLSAGDDESLAAAAVRAGAQDFLVQGRVDRRALPGVVLRAVERHRRIARLHQAVRPNECRDGLRDALTGLLSEDLFRDRLAHSVARADRAAGVLSLMLIQIDHNDVLRELCGPEAGDDVMRKAAVGLGRFIRRSDTLARVGGDGFGVILEGIQEREGALRAALPLLEAVAEIRADAEAGLDVQGLSASIGIARFPQDGVDVATLVRNAEIARREAALSGGGRVHFAGQSDLKPSSDRGLQPSAAA